MTKKLSPLVFFGTEDFSAHILESLIDSRFEIEAVITKPDRRVGRGRMLRPSKVKLLAQQTGLKVLEVANPEDLYQAVASTHRQTGILASFGLIVPDNVINMFLNGIINVHPSLLPAYRGPSPIESAILNGNLKTGVSIISLGHDVDAGDIYSQETIALTRNENKAELYTRLAEAGANLLIKTLDEIEIESINPKSQDGSQATYTKIIIKQDGLLRPNDYSATDLERQIRAYQGFPKSHIFLVNQDCIILAAHTSKSPQNNMSILCKDGEYLNIDYLVNSSGRQVSIIDFMNGLKH